MNVAVILDLASFQIIGVMTRHQCMSSKFRARLILKPRDDGDEGVFGLHNRGFKRLEAPGPVRELLEQGFLLFSQKQCSSTPSGSGRSPRAGRSTPLQLHAEKMTAGGALHGVRQRSINSLTPGSHKITTTHRNVIRSGFRSSFRARLAGERLCQLVLLLGDELDGVIDALGHLLSHSRWLGAI